MCTSYLHSASGSVLRDGGDAHGSPAAQYMSAAPAGLPAAVNGLTGRRTPRSTASRGQPRQRTPGSRYFGTQFIWPEKPEA
jgi:hypothetical protein